MAARSAGDLLSMLAAQVHAQLAAGGFHSGADLARHLGVSRNAIWKAVVALRELGLEVHAVRNRGYRLPIPCEPLDAAAIHAALPDAVRRRIRHLETVWSVESTNSALLARTDLPPGLADILVAEYQTAGRGRRGRTWLAPPGGAICLSLGWSFPQLPRDLSALGLAVGVCALRALRRRIPRASSPAKPLAGPLALKWPNDLTLDDRKLGGILIEMRAESEGPTYVVIGIGINVALGAGLVEQVAATGTHATDLAAAGADPRERNAIIAALAEELLGGLVVFQQEGLRPFAAEWKAADALLGRPITVQTGETRTKGVARGIDASGTLLVETAQGLQRLISGDVSVRADHGV
jgi:BirA family transcriptional regulator, biotin operon repressor / biotin---[acetyl-CoA-carboxylase] ligase